MPRPARNPPPAELVRLGSALRKLREGRDLSQLDVATVARASEGQVSDVERAKSNPGWLLLMRMLDGLGASLSELADTYESAEDD
jgi:transcriptional regulator with XRE-family HTH domain